MKKDKIENITVDTRQLNRNNPREAAVEEIGERLNAIALIYDPALSLQALTSLTLNYAIRYEMDKEVFLKAMDGGFDLIKEEFEKMYKEKQEKK